MSTNAELISQAQQVAGKGVAVDDGFTYSVPASDLKRYRDTIHGLIYALEAAESDAARRRMFAPLADTAATK